MSWLCLVILESNECYNLKVRLITHNICKLVSLCPPHKQKCIVDTQFVIIVLYQDISIVTFYFLTCISCSTAQYFNLAQL